VVGRGLLDFFSRGGNLSSGEFQDWMKSYSTEASQTSAHRPTGKQLVSATTHVLAKRVNVKGKDATPILAEIGRLLSTQGRNDDVIDKIVKLRELYAANH
jgi:hypothetical protein